MRRYKKNKKNPDYLQPGFHTQVFNFNLCFQTISK